MTTVQERPPLGASEADLELLLLIRHFEQQLLELFAAGELSGTTHTCLGQEYIPVALRTLLRPDDFVFSNHRGHGHYLARFADPAGLLAEIMGREGAVCNGVGGSQHILRDGFLSTGVQGQSLPVAAGVALHLSRAEAGALAVAHIGDGTWGEGAVYEALNLAALWRLPLLVVAEHNGIAQSTPTELQLAGSVAGRAAAFGIEHARVTSQDLGEIRALLEPLLAAARSGPAPLVVEFVTHRLGPHSKGDDTRPAEVLAAAAEHDWYPAVQDERFRQADERIREQVAAVAREVAARPRSVWADRGCR
ncbi:thiamine pyrophosphate-dependent dehydrogenase E1 component subunit alpha [Nonomuraea gerenzanensis]|uniref:Acetoin dehydrogenase E1 component alpha-subunit n=1 Tax=Nonomuraea gerenzanensis TaxID=93944 RepID=A0A1M4DYT5_9ACTN|nr:thiamine pyrophosphate-dependent dehydrogenase E1 component subunit alpha [Nonomuraea gerenzanensis]UBU14006.1 thiamine pyrophosphate-dependent dehydrogenase E1 component subunit alpha [Nonomuraea gerenzanensis]SBO91690.1 Acetoin dehydrogenase E1 component alpha-subunit [Nonomuraea gerenzanensis]